MCRQIQAIHLHHPRRRHMDRLAKVVGILFIVGHIMTETHGFLYHFYPKSETIYLDLFWSSSFKLKLNVLWYFKTFFDDGLLVLILYSVARMVYERSIKLYMIAIIYMLYHIVDIFCFMYNYKQTWEIYWALLYASTAATLILIIPHREKMHSIK